jgi:DNA-binding transcriptional ArsR family regulator
MRRDVFQAIADPTRREIIKLVSKEKLNLNSIAERFDISRPAISKHIRILSECGLIVVRQEGRERYCEARLGSLRKIAAWVKQYQTFWTSRLDALEKYLEEDKLSDIDKKRLK